MDDKFISEPIKPVEGTFDTAGMPRGEPLWSDEAKSWEFRKENA